MIPCIEPKTGGGTRLLLWIEFVSLDRQPSHHAAELTRRFHFFRAKDACQHAHEQGDTGRATGFDHCIDFGEFES